MRCSDFYPIFQADSVLNAHDKCFASNPIKSLMFAALWDSSLRKVLQLNYILNSKSIYTNVKEHVRKFHRDNFIIAVHESAYPSTVVLMRIDFGLGHQRVSMGESSFQFWGWEQELPVCELVCVIGYLCVVVWRKSRYWDQIPVLKWIPNPESLFFFKVPLGKMLNHFLKSLFLSISACLSLSPL